MAYFIIKMASVLLWPRIKPSQKIRDTTIGLQQNSQECLTHVSLFARTHWGEKFKQDSRTIWHLEQAAIVVLVVRGWNTHVSRSTKLIMFPRFFLVSHTSFTSKYSESILKVHWPR